jgi:predicted dehydrogenase
MSQQPSKSTNLRRRGFLGVTGGAVVAASAQTLCAQTSEKVRVALIGTGARGSDLLRALTTIQSVDVVGIADDYPPHLAKAAKYAGPQAKTFSDYRKLLDELKPQAVVIAVPLYLHFQVACDVLEAGCDVFVEKTMCYDMDQARKLAKLVEEKQAVCQVGLQRRANPIYQQAAAMVKAGMIGQVTAIKGQWHRNNNWRRPVPVMKSDPNWTSLERRLNWRLYNEYSRGLLAELGSHQMDVANWLLGGPPKRAFASGGIDYWQDGREVYDNVFCIYEYDAPSREQPPEGSSISAVKGQAVSTGAAKPYTVRVTWSSICNNAYEGAAELVLGTKGSLFLTTTKGLFYREPLPDDPGWVKASGDQNAAVLTAGKTLHLSNSPWAHRGEPLEIDLLQADDTRDELVSFVDHVQRRDRATICDVREGLRDTATVLMAHDSLDRGGWVACPTT